MIIPFGKPNLDNKEKKEVLKVLNSSALTHGKYSKKFEDLFCKKFNYKYSLSVSSCTAALHLSYMALNLKKGDEVIVPNQTHVSTVHTCEILGVKPIFIDCDKTTGNIDVNQIEAKITKKTKAITIVHFLGKPVDMDKILRITKKYKLFLIEDCALSIGAKYKDKFIGSYGDFACFSFYPTKHITTADGGMLVCKSEKYYKKTKLLKGFGVDKNLNERKIPGNYDVKVVGLNYRMDEIRSAIGIHQLLKLDKFIKSREKNFHFIKDRISNIQNIRILETETTKNFKSSYFGICIILDNKIKKRRFEIINEFKKLGIGTSIHYPRIVSDYTYYKKKYHLKRNRYKNACEISYNSFNLPVSPHLQKKDLEYIVKETKKLLESIK
jgi:perosamine synthetase